jgi:hypothetical protein
VPSFATLYSKRAFWWNKQRFNQLPIAFRNLARAQDDIKGVLLIILLRSYNTLKTL